jgi:Flp pilus assembly protein CpaB
MASGGRRSGLIFIIIALVILAILAAVYFLFPVVRNQIFAPKTQPGAAIVQPQTEMTNIIITVQNIPRGSLITESVIATIPYPKKDLVAGTFFTDKNDVINKQAKFDLDARIPITANMLVSGQVGSYAAFQIPKGYVAISIPISKLTAVAFAPVVGDHVNVIASFLVVDIDPATQSRLPNNSAAAEPPRPFSVDPPDKGSLGVTITGGGDASKQGRVDLDTTLNQPIYVVPSESQRPRLVSQMVIQDAIILRVGNFPAEALAKTSGVEPTPAPAAGGAAATTTPPPTPDMMTLIIRPQDAITLNYLMLSGSKLSLALRAAGDIDPAAVEAVTLQYLFQTYNIPNPPKTNFGTEPRYDGIAFPNESSAAKPTVNPNQ